MYVISKYFSRWKYDNWLIKKILIAVEDGELAENMADKIGSTSFRELVFDRPFFFTANIYFSNAHNHELLTGVYYGPETTIWR